MWGWGTRKAGEEDLKYQVGGRVCEQKECTQSLCVWGGGGHVRQGRRASSINWVGVLIVCADVCIVVNE